jgi:uncharacterized protein YndB with AHSA1/START domain
MKNKTLKKKIRINAPVNEVWHVITSPNTICQYLFDANVETDWQQGSPISYYGTWEGKEYRDKGTILDIEENKLLRHTHWSELSGKPDAPEYYYKVTYELEAKGDDKTLLTLSQSGPMNEEAYEHSSKMWEQALEKLKEVAEKEAVHS